MKKSFNSALILLSAITLLLFSCNTWMSSDGFYSDIERDVKVANAAQIQVYVRYAMTRQGKTIPEGYNTFKVEIPHEISATTEPEYGFVRWAAFPTSFLAPGDNQSRNRNIYFIDDDDYNDRILPYEITSPDVEFDDPRSPTTKVTINVNRNDLFIVPIIAQRPTVGLTIPGSGETKVVKNTSVRINFTKPMNPASFQNSEGDWDKISITQGTTTNDANGDIDVLSEDISERFQAPSFSLSRKTITIKFKPEELATGYPSNAKISIKISKDVQDIFGFSMTDDEKVNFTVGSATDTLAPRIVQLTGGMLNKLVPNSTNTGTTQITNFAEFQGMYRKDTNLTNLGQNTKITVATGSDTVYSEAVNKDLSNSYWNTYINNRVSKKIVLRIEAKDISGSTSSDDLELDVASVAIRARPVFEATGTGSRSTGSYSTVTANSYGPQLNSTSLTETYANLVGTVNNLGSYNLSQDNGCLVEYDLSSLPDGLLQIDVWAFDVIGNSGLSTDITASNFAQNSNSWASLFVVKDSTAPQASGEITLKLGNTSLSSGDNRFFNAASYDTLKISADSATNGIISDPNLARLSSPHNKLKWIIKPCEGTSSTADTSWISEIAPTDSLWKPVTQDYTGFEQPDNDYEGEITLTAALMDDLGNISVDPIVLRSIRFDNKKPVINEENKLSWIADTNATAGVASENFLDKQTLVIPVTEGLSGVHSVTLSITGGANGTSPFATPFSNISNSSFEVYAGTTKLSSSAYSVSSSDPKTLVFADSAVTDELTSITNKNITIKGITISNAANAAEREGTYTIKATVTDAAGNSSTSENSDNTAVTLAVDSTSPSVERIVVPDLIKTVRYTTATPVSEYWIDYNSSNLNKTLTTPLVNSVYVHFNETISGARVFNFAGSTMSLTDNSKFYKVSLTNGNYVRESADPLSGSLNTSQNTWTATRPVELKSDNEIIVEITNVSLGSATASTASNLSLKIIDTATNESAVKDTIERSSNANITENIPAFSYDSGIPDVTSIALTDRGAETGKRPANKGYTSEAHVTATVRVVPSASGIYELTVSDQAVFDSTTTIRDVTGTAINLDYDIVTGTNSRTIRFKKPGTGSERLDAVVGASGTSATAARDLEIDNLKLVRSDGTSPDGSYTVLFKSKSLAGRSAADFSGTKTTVEDVLNERSEISTAGTAGNTIKLDTTVPVWINKGLYSALYPEQNLNPQYVYPRPSSTEKSYGISFGTKTDSSNPNSKDILYFYNSSYIRINPDYTETNFRNVTWSGSCFSSGSVDYAFAYDSSFTTTNGLTAVIHDKAGNVSEPIKFFVINDTSFDTNESSIDNYMTLLLPGNARIFRNTTLASNTHQNGKYEFLINNTSGSMSTYNYIIKGKSEDEESYKIKIKLGSGVTSSDVLIDGTAPATSGSAYTEFNTDNTAKATTAASPITNYSISHWYRTSSSLILNAPIPYTPDDFSNTSSVKCTWHDYKKSNPVSGNQNPALDTSYSWNSDSDIKSRIDENGDIIIQLPKATDCPPLALFLKDGCGNVTYRLIRPASMTSTQAVSWIIDNQVGLPDWSPEASVNNSSAVSGPDTTHVVLSGNLYTDISDVTLYKTAGIQIKKLSDTSRFPSSVTPDEDHFSLKSRVIVWTNDSRAPVRDDFYSSTLVDSPTATSQTASTWSYETEKNDANSSIYTGTTGFDLPVNTLPKYNPTVTSANDVRTYKLFVIIEDYVGNYKIYQINRSVTGSVSKWLYDETPPLLEATAEKVNNIGGKNYYSNNSTAQYTIKDFHSGIKNIGGNNSDNSSPSDFAHRVTSYPETGTFTYSLATNPDANGRLFISGVNDWADNGSGRSVGLSYGGSDSWVRQTTAPTLGTASAIVITDSTTTPPTTSTSGIWATPVNDTTTGGKKLPITSKAANQSISVTLKVTDTEELLGWYVKDGTPFDSGASEIAASTFYSSNKFSNHTTNGSNGNTGLSISYNSTSKEYTYTVSKDDATSPWPAGKKYFYPVNRAGLIASTPILVEFLENPIPAISGTISYNDSDNKPTVGYYGSGDSAVNYIKAGSKITLTTTGSPTTCVILDSADNTLATYTLNTSETTHELAFSEISTANLQALNGGALYLKLSTATEDGAKTPLTGPAGKNSWKYDATAPSFSINPANITADGTVAAVQYPATTGTYWIKGDTVYIPFTSADTDIGRYLWSVDGGEYTSFEVSGNTVDTTNKVFRFPAPVVAAKTYNFKLEDQAQNVSEPAFTSPITIQKDNTGPLVTGFNYSLTAGYYNASTPEGTTNTTKLRYNTSQITGITFSYTDRSDNASGFDNLYYRLNGSDTPFTASNSITLSSTSSGTYQILAKDHAGNETSLWTYILEADSDTPDFALATTGTVTTDTDKNTYYKTTDNTYYVNGTNASIHFTKTASNIITKYEHKLSTEADDQWVELTDSTPGFVKTDTTVTYTFAAQTSAETHQFRASDDVGHTGAVQSVTIAKDTAGPSGTFGYTFTTTDSKKTENTNAETNTITIGYNKSAASTIDFTFTDISEAAGYDKLYYKLNGGAATAMTSNAISGLNNLENGSTYEIIAKDVLGNETSLKTFVFRGVSGGPKVAATKHPQYSGLQYVPTYPKVTNPNEYTNGTWTYKDTNWIKAFDADTDVFFLTEGGTDTLTEPTVTVKIFGYNEDGTPKDGDTANTVPSSYNVRQIKGSAVKFRLPVMSTSLPSDKLYYGISYNTTADPTWSSEPVDVVTNNGKTCIENIPLDLLQINKRHTFIFVWYKDELGNISVYNLTHPAATGQNWWTTDASAGTSGDFSDLTGDTAAFVYRSAGTTTGKGRGNRILGGDAADSEKPLTRVVEWFSSIQDAFTSDTEVAANPVKTSKKEAKKASKKSAKKAKKTVAVAETSVTANPPAAKALDIAPIELKEESVEVTTPETSAAEKLTTEEITTVAAESTSVESVESVETQTVESAEATSVKSAEKSSSKAPVIVVMLAILSACGGAWFTRKRKDEAR